MTDWIRDNGSIVILGKTQTGKTTAARQLFLESDRLNIWLMPMGDEKIPMPGSPPTEKAGTVTSVRSEQALWEAVAEGRRHIIYRSTDVRSDVVGLRESLWDFSERGNRNVRVSLFVDEIHNVAPQSGKTDLPPRDAVRKIAKEGQKRGIKLVAITQDPVSMDKQALRQMEYLLVFPISPPQRDPFDRWGMDWAAVSALPEHCAVLFRNEIAGEHGNAEVHVEQVCPSGAFAL